MEQKDKKNRTNKFFVSTISCPNIGQLYHYTLQYLLLSLNPNMRLLNTTPSEKINVQNRKKKQVLLWQYLSTVMLLQSNKTTLFFQYEICSDTF